MKRVTLCIPLFALSLTAQGWIDRTPMPAPASPPPRVNANMCWDAARGHVLLFGGNFLTDTWSWNGTAWTPLASLPTLGGTLAGSQAMTSHPPTNEVVLVNYSNTWTWNGVSWVYRPLATLNAGTGTPVTMSMGRDPVRGETVLFIGGRLSGGVIAAVSETWIWDGFTWTQRFTPTSPGPAATSASMAFDPVAGRLLLQVRGTGVATFWEWTGGNWLQRLYGNVPTAGGAMATDTVRNTVVLFDGVLDGSSNHTWLLANGHAQRIATPVEPARRAGAAMAFDPVRGKTVLFGGSNGFDLGDTWEFSPGAGASYVPFGTGCPGARGVPTLAAQTNSLPRVGETFSVQIGNVPFTGLVFLFLGFSNSDFGGTALPFSLATLGAPGCNVLCSGDQSYLLPNLLGTSVWSVAVPNLPGIAFFNQAFVFDAPANALGVTVSNAAQGVVGF